MKPQTNNKALPTVLFVDDEELAQKYFRKAIATSYEVLTASDVAEAKGLLSQHADRIGVVVTDQRMPNASGTSLLRQINEQHPEIIRILTTAYSDLESAIEAVNEGHIYRYVTKPWEVRDLQAVVRQAVELYCLQREYDTLIAEKLSVIQRMVLTDRAKTLCLLGSALQNTANNPLYAVRDYIRFTASSAAAPTARDAAGWEDLWTSTVDETIAAVQIVDLLFDALKAAPGEPQQTDIGELISDRAEGIDGLSCKVSQEAGPILAEPDFLKRWTDLLLRFVEAISEGSDSVAIACQPSDEGAHIVTHLSGQAGPQTQVNLLKLADGSRWDTKGPHLDLLILFFATHHLGGQVDTRWGAEGAFEFRFVLPCGPATSSRDPLPENWVELLFDEIEQ
ncbi:MAG: response regulator [Phycisphaeraceae bacterium]|nr:response regulator [Phycisphaeraceae bacterium]